VRHANQRGLSVTIPGDSAITGRRVPIKLVANSDTDSEHTCGSTLFSTEKAGAVCPMESEASVRNMLSPLFCMRLDWWEDPSVWRFRLCAI
jgi:hypothetical protein